LAWGKIIDFLISYAKERDEPVKDVRVGLNWTCVLSKNLGVAMTYKIGWEIKDAGRLDEMTTGELAELLKSWNLVEASVGLASINSTIDVKTEKTGNGLEIGLKMSKGKRVIMIGKFPGYTRFKGIAKEFYVLELNPNLIDLNDGILPSTASEELLERSDIVIMTATTIINKSVDRLLELAKNVFVIMVGPSTPMIEELLDFGIDVLAGLKVINPYSLMKKISQGMVNEERLKGDASFVIMTKKEII